MSTNLSHISRAYILKSKRFFNVKSSTYFHMKTEILTNFQICISMPLTKATSKTLLLPFTKNTDFEKTPFDVLLFHHSFQFGCVYLQVWFKQTYVLKTVFSDKPTHSCAIQEMWSLKYTDNLFDYWKHYRHIYLKEKKPVLLVYR